MQQHPFVLTYIDFKSGMPWAAKSMMVYLKNVFWLYYTFRLANVFGCEYKYGLENSGGRI